LFTEIDKTISAGLKKICVDTGLGMKTHDVSKEEFAKVICGALWTHIPHELALFTPPERASTADKKQPRLSSVVATLKVVS